MTLTEVGLQRIEPEEEVPITSSLEHPEPCRSPVPGCKACFRDEESLMDKMLPRIAIAETVTSIKLVVPLNGADPRHAFVFATPTSILIEIRITNIIERSRIVYKEIQHQRITRDLKLDTNIQEGSTRVRMLGDNLEITCTKALSGDDKVWSELVYTTTRSSLGCITSAS